MNFDVLKLTGIISYITTLQLLTLISMKENVKFISGPCSEVFPNLCPWLLVKEVRFLYVYILGWSSHIYDHIDNGTTLLQRGNKTTLTHPLPDVMY